MKPWWIRVMGVTAFALFLGSGALAMWSRGIVGRNDFFLLAGLGAMLSVFLGAIWILFSVGHYVLRKQVKGAASASLAARPQAVTVCDVCAARPPCLWCQTHRLRICAVCVGSHDDGETCLYVTVYRGGLGAGVNPRAVGK